MARARMYRNDQQCPRCGSNRLPKYGRLPEARRYVSDGYR